MTIKVKFTEQDLVNSQMVIYFRRPLTRLLFGVLGLLFMATLLLGLAFDRELAVQSLTYLIPATILCGSQILAAKSRFRADTRYKDPVEYDFGNEMLTISGDQFVTEMKWSSIRKILKTKNWILIRQNRKITAAIPKAAFWETELEELKVLLDQKKVKNNL